MMRPLAIAAVICGLAGIAATLAVVRTPDPAALARVPVDLPWWLFLLGTLGVLATSRRGLSIPAVFVAMAVCVALFVPAYSFFFAPLQPVPGDDSWAYTAPLVHGSYTNVRNSGYATFVLVVGKLTGLAALPLIQLLVQIACYLIAVWLIARAYGWRWVGPILALVFVFQGVATDFSARIMTEAMFSAGFVLFAGGLAAGARKPTTDAFAFAGLGLMIAVAAKSVGIVLVVPAILVVRFLPRDAMPRCLAILTLPSVALYLAMCWHGYVRTGRFLPEQFAGYALIGHVGWMIDGAVSDQPGLAEALRASVQPVLACRPEMLEEIKSKSDLDRYVNYTANEYNALLWSRIVPAGQSLGIGSDALNDLFLRLALSSIARHPASYARHVAAHFYGLWSSVAAGESLSQASVEVRNEVFEMAPERRLHYQNELGGLIDAYLDAAAAKRSARMQASLPLAFERLAGEEAGLFTEHAGEIGIALGVLALALSALVLVPGSLSATYRAEIMLALVINAYFLANALLQPLQLRYALVAHGAVLLLGAGLISTTASALKLGPAG